MIPLLLLMLIIPISFICMTAVFRKHSSAFAIISVATGLCIVVYLTTHALMTGNPTITESFGYIPSLGIGFDLATSPASLILLLMSSVVLLATAIAGNIGKERQKAASLLLILFQLASAGLFLSGNFFIFFIFWDIGVIAPFFMINVLGSANRKAASYKFLIYEIFASALLLFGIILIYFYAPGHTLNIATLATVYSAMPIYIQKLVFALLFLAFMINIPMFPLHTWLPDAHSEASTQGSMILSGILTKFGGYGMLVIFLTMPIAHNYSQYVAILATVSAFYAAFMMMRQRDIKRIVAYTTIIEMSIIAFAISTMTMAGNSGAVYGMFAHGVVVAALFLCAGAVEKIFSYRNIDLLRGVSHSAKLTSYVFLIGVFAITGLPLTASFIADIMIVLGGIAGFGVYGIIPIFALVLMGAFMYFVINKSFFANKEQSQAVDFIGARQKLGYSILIVAIFLFGVLPFLLTGLLNTGIV